MKIQCGDIIETTAGVMLVEKIKDDGSLVGHRLGDLIIFHGKVKKVLCSDFRYTNTARERIAKANMEVLL